MDSARYLRWCVIGAMAAVAIGWVGAMLNLSGRSPVGLLPLGMGIALGATLHGLAAGQGVTCRKRLVVGAVLLAILTVAAEHAWLYRDYRRQWWQVRAEQPVLAIFRPEETAPLSLTAYFAREMEVSRRRAALWAVDAALVLAGTVGIEMVWRRQHP